MMSTDSSPYGNGDAESFPANPPPPEPMFEMANQSNSGLSVDDENPGFDQGHSLPNVQELKTEHQADNKRSGRWIVWFAIFMALVVIGAIIGIAVAATSGGNSSPKSTISSSNANTPSPVPVDQRPESGGKDTIDDLPPQPAPTNAPGPTLGPGPTMGPGPTTAPGPTIGPRPTLSPGASSARTESMKTYLIDQGISKEADLNDPTTPQAQALQFISEGDGYLMDVPAGDMSTPEGYDFMTRYVLSTLFYATEGDRWTFNLNFLRPTGVCAWGVVFQYTDMSRAFRGVLCDEETNQVSALFLNQNNLAGTLPDELGLLTTLVNMNFHLNELRGTIPESFQNMKNMLNMFLSFNSLTGSFPAWVDNIPTLQNLDLAHNFLIGSIPASVGGMSNLEGLAVDNNMLTNRIDAVFDTTLVPGLRKLGQFYAENNQFTGALGENFMKDCQGLGFLDLSDNRFTGSVPSHLFGLPMLEVLDIHDNDFTALPDSFPENTKLDLLAMQKCRFASELPPTISNFKSLTHLDVSQNRFIGEMPSEIGLMTNLTYLFLAQNDFTPNNIPYWLQGMTKLEELDLKSTQRTGPIPDWIGTDLQKIVLLDLDANNLDGTIPESLGTMPDLHILLLNRNNLTSAIPSSFSNLLNLKLLFIEANTEITGSLGEIFCDNPNFVEQPVIVANCDLCNASPDCCRMCCEQGVECNDGIHVPDLDPIWQLGYERVFFTFGREDYFMKEGADGEGRRMLANID